MEVHINIFGAKLRELLSEQVEQSFDFRLQLMERDVADIGVQCIRSDGIVMDVGTHTALARPGCHGDGDLVWALMIEKPFEKHEYRYPPKLILIARQQKKKLNDTDIIFQNLIDGWGYQSIYSPRCVETQLLFHLRATGD